MSEAADDEARIEAALRVLSERTAMDWFDRQPGDRLMREMGAMRRRDYQAALAALRTLAASQAVKR
jgi:hypothetical protein